MVGRNVLLVKDSQGEGYQTFRLSSPCLWVSGPPQPFRTARVGPEALGDQPLYHSSPDEPEVRLGYVGGPYKAPAHFGNWSQTPSQGSDSQRNNWFLGPREGSAFCLQSLANVKSSHTKPVTNTKFFWKAIFGVQSKPKHSFPICFSLCRWTERKGKNRKDRKRWLERKNLLRCF